MVRFFLGTHRPHWLGLTTVPLMVSHRTLKDYRTLPVALGPWILDSGGFTELATYGRWVTGPGEYLTAIARYRDEVGGLQWAAPQDWMCEPFMVAKTRLSVAEHQQLTVDNYLLLRTSAPELPIIPVLQGWSIDDYLRCIDLYAGEGIDLTAEVIVGLGSVCRRQNLIQIDTLVRRLAGEGLALHGFGVKTDGLVSYGRHLASADSMAWSFNARYERSLPGCPHSSCANCLRYALTWRDRLLDRIDTATAGPDYCQQVFV